MHPGLKITAPYDGSLILRYFPLPQIEFARLNLTYTVISKRKLRMLVEEALSAAGRPRIPTVSGLRRRACPEAIRDFCDGSG